MGGRVRAKLTYANVMSSLAVFGMLAGGGALAASKIGTAQIRNGAITASKLGKNAVTSQKIKSGAVTGSKVANHSLTGAKIIISTLGAVPLASHASTADRASSAEHAVNADSLGGLAPASFERAGHLVQIAARMSNTEPDRAILTAGPFTVSAHCAAANPLQNVIGASVTTSENDSAVHGHDFLGNEMGNADLDVGSTQQLSLYQESGSPPLPAGPFPTTWFFASPSGTQVALTLTLATRIFSDNASQRVACAFGGFAVVS
jgi:hypothetical protein